LALVDTSEPEQILERLDQVAVASSPADQLAVLAAREVYLTDCGFDLEAMLDFYAAELEGIAQGSAYGCVRTFGEMTWALRDVPGVEDLLVYEARVNQVLARHPDTAISLCVYDVDRFDGEVIVGILRTHPKVALSGTILDNPFFIPPQEFLRQRN
jgi:hypothetical protein